MKYELTYKESGESKTIYKIIDLSEELSMDKGKLSQMFIDDNDFIETDEWVCRRTRMADIRKKEKENKDKKKYYKYLEYIDKTTNETSFVTFAELSEKVNIKKSNLYRILRKQSVIETDTYKAIKHKNYTKKEEKAFSQKSDRKKKRSIEAELREGLDEKQYAELMEKQMKRKRIMDWKCNESFKDENSITEMEKMKEWEDHNKRCCKKSSDDKVWIPKSLIKEIPELKNFTLPKSMF